MAFNGWTRGSKYAIDRLEHSCVVAEVFLTPADESGVIRVNEVDVGRIRGDLASESSHGRD